jgi:hypothetical protein
MGRRLGYAPHTARERTRVARARPSAEHDRRDGAWRAWLLDRAGAGMTAHQVEQLSSANGAAIGNCSGQGPSSSLIVSTRSSDPRFAILTETNRRPTWDVR